jgi:hypothetical protein
MVQIVADVESGLSLTPPQEKRRKTTFLSPYAYDLKHKKKRREHITITDKRIINRSEVQEGL